MTGPGRDLWVGTLNVQSLTGKVGAVVATATTAGLNVVALQETMLASDSFRATSQAFRAAGWAFHRGAQGRDSRGGVAAGVGFITDVPAQLIEIPEELQHGGRVAAIKVARRRQRPLLVLNVYLPAADKVRGNKVAMDAVEWARGTGEDFVLLGDWNRREDAFPLAGLLAKGVVWTMDGGQCPRSGTYRRGGLLTTHIDFGLASPRLPVDERRQWMGVADHDLVGYRLQGYPDETVWRWQPQRRLLPEARVDWETVWPRFAEDFDEAVAQGNVTQAWQALSAAAEELFADPQARPARPRAVPGKPVAQDQHQGRCRDVQSLWERRLRRVARRAEEAGRNYTDALGAKLQRDLVIFAKDYPDLLDMPDYQTVAYYLLAKADQEAQRVRACRVRRWKEEIQDDVGAMTKWVTAKEAEEACTTKQLGECPSKGAVARRLTDSLSRLWNEAAGVDTDHLESFLCALGEDRPSLAAGFTVDGHRLLRRARKAKAKAGGLDGWTGTLFAQLPSLFFDRLADVWRLVLCGNGVPEGWRQVRVVAIPKPDGGSRPLALTQMAWRVGASELLSQLRAWFGAWMPPELCGGLPGRSADTVHQDLGVFVQQRATSRSFVGCKADVRKCFDRVSPTVALRVLRWWGAPQWLLQVLASFYDQQERWVAAAGCYATTPVAATCSLLQGCPFSPLLVNGMMAAWALHVKRAAPNIRMGIFLDDRTLYTKGYGSVEKLVAAAQAGQFADKALGFELHPEKLAAFGSNVAKREALMEHADLLGVPQTDFVLLGVNYRLEGHQAFAAKDVTVALRNRGRRIGRVAVSTTTRARLASMLMVSKFRFRAPWTRFSKASLRDWSWQVEAAVWGGPLATGRSALLLWTFVGVDLHPEFAVVTAVLKREWTRLGSGSTGAAGPQVAAALSQVQWRVRGSLFVTPMGSFDAAEVTAKGFLERLREAWRRVLWERDSKTAGPLGATQVPLLQPHRRFGCDGRALKLRVATGAATDGRDLVRLQKQKDCPCGTAAPSRHHLTFECPCRPWPGDLRTEQERRLLCAVVDFEPYTFEARDDEETHVGELAATLATLNDGVLVATDGGAKLLGEHYNWRAAAWAVVVDGKVFSGLVTGAERTAAAGERTAFRVLCRAASMAQRKVKVLVDNLPICQGSARRRDFDREDRELWSFWNEVRAALPFLSVAWIPSHGKRKEWRPPEGWPSAGQCRKLNEDADEAATKQLDRLQGWWQQLKANVTVAEDWTWRALNAQLAATQAWHDSMKEVLQQRRILRRTAAQLL